MFHYSFSTVLMTVITSTVLIGLIAICLRSRKMLLSIGYKLLAVLIVLTLIRFLYPVELTALVRNIFLPVPLSVAVLYIRHTFFTLGGIDLSIWFLLECVWYSGILYKLIRMLISHIFFSRFIRRYGVNVTAKGIYASIMTQICDGRKNTFRIILLPGLDTPRQSGALHPSILLPRELELTEEELYYTLCHEVTHYRHRDFLIKLGMSLLSAVYWWNPLCKVLAGQLDILLEIRVDEDVTQGDPLIKAVYYKALLNVGKGLVSNPQEPKCPVSPATPGAVGSITDLTKRAEMIFYYKKASIPVFMSLLLLVSALFICSYCFTFESYHLPERDEMDNNDIPSNYMYAVPLEDGTYDIYWDGIWIEHVDTLKYHPNVPIANPK